jgi:hypothetical protein
MQHAVLLFHSYLRWPLLALGIALVVLATGAWRRGSNASPRRISLAALICLDLQLVAGLLLYAWPGSIARLALSDPASAMRNASLRFWAVEHISLMLLAVVVVHIGRVAARRAKSAPIANRRTAISWAVALLLMIVAIPWPLREAVGRPLLRLW